MRIDRVYVDVPLNPGERVVLSGDAFRHLGTVLRKRAGEEVELFNGHGACVRARITRTDRGRMELEPGALQAVIPESPLALTLVQGISRAQHMDYTIQKSVELGVSRIVPVLSRHGNVRLDDAQAERRMAHWRKIIIGACEQSGRNRLPQLLAPRSLEAWLAEGDGEMRLILDPQASAALASVPGVPGGVVLLCGPEGGFSEAEMASARAHGYQGVRVGPRVLRTETAAVAALALCQGLWGDLR